MIDWDDAFDNSGYVPGSRNLPDQWAARATAFRASISARSDVDIRYGPHSRMALDRFPPDGANAAGTLIFVHGGYWHLFDKSYWSHLAAGPLAHG